MKKIFSLFLAALMLMTMSACVKDNKKEDKNKTNANETQTEAVTDKNKNVKIEEEQVRTICKLATLECKYHNVAISKKSPPEGMTHTMEKDRDFWIEYTGIARIGIDMSKLQMKVDKEKNTVYISLPKAELLNISIDPDSYDKNSFVMSKDSMINKNPITAEDQSAAVGKAQNEMAKEVRGNSELLQSAQGRAKRLIENYIDEVGKLTGVEYNIVWGNFEDEQASTKQQPTNKK